MNKKIIGIVIGVVALILVVVVGSMKNKGIDPGKGVVQALGPSVEVDSPAQLLPSDTVLYYSISNIEDLWNTVEKSNFWNKLTTLQFWKDVNFEEVALNPLRDLIEEQIQMELDQKKVMALLGRQLTISLALEKGKSSPDVKVFVQASVSRMARLLEGALKGQNQEESGLMTLDYQGQTIYLYPKKTENAFDIRFALVNDILTVGVGNTEKDMKAIVDMINKKGGTSLAKSDNFKKAQTLMGSQIGFTSYFTDFVKISEHFDSLFQLLLDVQPEQLQGINPEEVKKNLAKLKFICGTGNPIDKGLRMRSFVEPNFSAMSEKEVTQWKEGASPLTIMNFAPKEALVVNASGNIDASGLWANWMAASNEAGAEGTNPMGDFIAQLKAFEEAFGINVEKDIVPLIGSEYSFIFKNIGLDGVFPIPRLGMVLQSKDSGALKDKIAMVLKKVFSGEQMPIPLTLQEEKTPKGDILTVSTPLGEGLSPVIASTPNYVVISTNKSVLGDFQSAFQSAGSRVVDNDKYKKCFIDVPAKTTQKSFVDVKGINKMIQGIINWIVERNMLPQTPDIEEIKTNVLTYGVPVMKCFEVVDSIGFASYTKNDVAIQDVNLILDDAK